MGNPLEAAARSLLSSSKGNIPDLDKYLAIMNTPEGRKLLNSLSSKGGDSMKQSAQQAASGDMEATKRLVSQLLGSEEGQALAKQVRDIYKSK